MNSASYQSASDGLAVYGVILGYGHDRGGVLRDVLRILLNGVRGEIIHRSEESAEESNLPEEIARIDALPPGFNVTQCWVRSVGKIGVVMLRFTTTESEFRKLSRWVREINAGERSIEGDNIPVGAYQSAGNPPEERKGSSIRLRLHRTGRPWHLDASIRSGVLRYEGARTVWERPPEGTLESGQDLFEQLLHNLAADQELDVAQTDMVISEDGPAPVGNQPRTGGSPKNPKALALIRLFDLGIRGRYFIRKTIDEAREAIAGSGTAWPLIAQGDTHPGFSYADDGDSPDSVKVNAQRYIQDALRGPVREADPDAVVADIMVHALDVPGLLAEVYGFIKRQSFQIVRVCCRGLGSDAVVLLAVKLPRWWPTGTPENLSDAERALRLETLIRDRIDLFLHKNSEKARFAEIARGMMHPAGYWRVFVHLATTVSDRSRNVPLQAFVQSQVDEIQDRPRLLVKLVRLLAAFAKGLEKGEYIDAHDQVSIFYLDVRPLRRGGVTYSEIGLGVSMPIKNAEHDHRIQTHFDDWFKKAFVTLQSLPYAKPAQD